MKPPRHWRRRRKNIAEARSFALAAGREHMEDWQQVRMITRALSSVLKDEIRRANDTDGVIETYDAENFMHRVEWLHEVMAQRAEKLRGYLQKAGVMIDTD
jgi:hypothetical protein